MKSTNINTVKSAIDRRLKRNLTVVIHNQVTDFLHQHYPATDGWLFDVHIWPESRKSTVYVRQAPAPLFIKTPSNREAVLPSDTNNVWGIYQFSLNKELSPLAQKFTQDIIDLSISVNTILYLRAGTEAKPFQVWGTFTEKLELV